MSSLLPTAIPALSVVDPGSEPADYVAAASEVLQLLPRLLALRQFPSHCFELDEGFGIVKTFREHRHPNGDFEKYFDSTFSIIYRDVYDDVTMEVRLYATIRGNRRVEIRNTSTVKLSVAVILHAVHDGRLIDLTAHQALGSDDADPGLLMPQQLVIIETLSANFPLLLIEHQQTW